MWKSLPGAGATCKRTVGAVVATGGGIDSLESFVETIQQRCPGITMFAIDEPIHKMTDDISERLR